MCLDLAMKVKLKVVSDLVQTWLLYILRNYLNTFKYIRISVWWKLLPVLIHSCVYHQFRLASFQSHERVGLQKPKSVIVPSWMRVQWAFAFLCVLLFAQLYNLFQCFWYTQCGVCELVVCLVPAVKIHIHSLRNGFYMRWYSEEERVCSCWFLFFREHRIKSWRRERGGERDRERQTEWFDF